MRWCLLRKKTGARENEERGRLRKGGGLEGKGKSGRKGGEGEERLAFSKSNVV